MFHALHGALSASKRPTTPTIWSTVVDSSFETTTINGVAYGAGKYVAVGNSGKIATSVNGTEWSLVAVSSFSTTAVYDVTYGSRR